MQPADLTLHTVSSASGPAAVFDVGEGLPIVFVHGYPGRPQDFRWLVPLLPDVRRIGIAFPGLDATPLSSGPDPSVDGRGRFLSGVLDAMGIDRCVMVGHSMGGVLAASVAARQPERVAGLGLVSSIGLSIHNGFRSFRPGLTCALATAPVISTLVRPLITKGFRQAGFPPGVSWSAMQHTLRCAAAIDFAENQAIYAAVRAPTLVAWTEDDRLIESAISTALAAAVPGGPRLSWPTGGHASVKSRAMELAEGLSAWLPTLS
ncbi:MAG: pimeloyl-ACP methyl ester carboxylesterase [Myxococcota bacterium]|jgi:pimeloyl-ACP methyl ester carboxylesterase